MLRKLFFVVCLLVVAASSAQAQSPTHSMSGTIVSEGCQYFAGLNPDWTCWITFEESGGQTFSVEVEGQAIGQAGLMGASLPRKAYVLYTLVPAGIDYLRGIVRTQVRGYYIVDAGPA